MQQMVQISSLAMELKDLTFAGMTSVFVSCLLAETLTAFSSVFQLFGLICLFLTLGGLAICLTERVSSSESSRCGIHTIREMTKAFKIG